LYLINPRLDIWNTFPFTKVMSAECNTHSHMRTLRLQSPSELVHQVGINASPNKTVEHRKIVPNVSAGTLYHRYTKA